MHPNESDTKDPIHILDFAVFASFYWRLQPHRLLLQLIVADPPSHAWRRVVLTPYILGAFSLARNQQ